MKNIRIYTDGACSGNQNEENIGGFGCVLEFKGNLKELKGAEINTTNNRMELSALIAGLSALKEKGLLIEVFADSSYLINCFKEKWYVSWQKNNWKNSAKKPVENRDLWEKLLALMDGQTLEFYLVKGHLSLKNEKSLKDEYKRFKTHNGNAFDFDDFKEIVEKNIRCDELANIAMDEIRGDAVCQDGESTDSNTDETKTAEAACAAAERRPAILFDLDGTLWDTSNLVSQAWNIALEKHYPNVSMRFDDEALKKSMGKTMKEIANMWFPEMTDAEQDELLKHLCEEENLYLKDHPGELFSGVRETLPILKKDYNLYVVSNCQVGYIEVFWESTGLADNFAGKICFGDTGLSKGENVKILLEREGIKKAVFVGDTAKDQEAAIFAGLPFIHAEYGFGESVNPQGRVKDFSELSKEVPKII